MAAVEQQQQLTASPFTPPSSPLSPPPSSPATVRSPSPSVFDVFPFVCEDPPIRALSGSQYYLIHEAYHSSPLPNDILFPWLHGVDGTSPAQNSFFGIQESPVPLHRGVTVVQAEEQTSKALLVGSIYPSDIFNPPVPSDDDNNCHEPRGFLKISDGEGINLRNFRIQVAKYATLSDIVVYGENGLNDTVLEIAKQAAWAQQALREENPNGIDYEVFVILDSFSFFEKEFPELVAIDTQGIIRNKVNFLEQEREEMRVLTAASEISHNVWLGNTQDVPVSNVSSDMDPADSAISLIDDNPHQFSICVESHDLAEMPDSATLRIASDQLANIPTCRPTQMDDIIHLDCISSGVGCTTFDATTTKLIDLCEFISTQSNKFGRKALIHCADGYTETSLLALTYLMYNDNLKLPQAYLKLQKIRSFFVYPTDVTTLLSFEKCILERKKLEQKPSSPSSPSSLQLLTPSLSLSQFQDEKKEMESFEKFPWFFSPFFEGSFPSRILPFLYLGNLNHACNAGMLKALGITHVLSVGEDSKLDKKEFEVYYLDNLYDDGIDSLWNHLDSCVNFIEDAQRSNGSILIHCRVGVSRSATITIAYIMRHLGKSLVSSYLYVRARRLNVIIQPNLKFMYELLQYEQKLTGRMNINWAWLAKEIHTLNMCYVSA